MAFWRKWRLAPKAKSINPERSRRCVTVEGISLLVRSATHGCPRPRPRARWSLLSR
eukprot:SAG11_NODE_294_length_11142_cov_7.050439_12_plen_56_part_00